MIGSANPWLEGRGARGAAYQARFDELAASGHHVHGEADLVASFAPRTVLDAGCGTGRVAAELARRGIAVHGVDLDAAMLAAARAGSPELAWTEADLATVDLGTRFDAVVMAGNVMVFLTPGTEGAVVTNMARHLAPGGLLIAGFTLGPGRLALADYDRLAAEAGLAPEERWATWDRLPYPGDSSYAVSVHRAGPGGPSGG